MECLWTKQAEERQKEWQTKLGVTREEVEEVLRYSGQIVAGDQSALRPNREETTGSYVSPFSALGKIAKS
jgi:hypothetical protein